MLRDLNIMFRYGIINDDCVLLDIGMNACDALMDSSPTSPSEGRHEAGSVQSSDSEFY